MPTSWTEAAAPSNSKSGIFFLAGRSGAGSKSPVSGELDVAGTAFKQERIKKNGFPSRKVRSWVIPPQADAEIAANIEEAPETYERPYDAQRPVACTGEHPVELVGETRESLPVTENHRQRVDCECERAGTAAVLMFCEPLGACRQATARKRRAMTDWAHKVASLPDGRHAGCGKVTLAPDNPNTSTKGAFCAAFEPELARGLVRRIEFCHTPKCGSWLNAAAWWAATVSRICRELHALEVRLRGKSAGGAYCNSLDVRASGREPVRSSLASEANAQSR